MEIIWQSHTLAKDGNCQEENEDAFSPNGNSAFSGEEPFICALADGATRTSFSSLWANLLVKSLADPYLGLTDSAVSTAQKEWSQTINEMKLPWHAEEKVKQGSFSTLLWFRVTPNPKESGEPGGPWEATAVGDSCLFQIRNEELITKYPIARSEDFANNPILISSIPERNQQIWETLSDKATRGTWSPGDQFLLMTDALACWFMRKTEQGNMPIQKLFCALQQPEVSDQSGFEKLILELRDSKAIKNDDTSLIYITIN